MFSVAGWAGLCKGEQREEDEGGEKDEKGEEKEHRREDGRPERETASRWLGLALERLKTNRLAGSIREFCSLQTPVIMFDKNSDYVVMTIEQVSLFILPCGSDRHCALIFFTFAPALRHAHQPSWNQAIRLATCQIHGTQHHSLANMRPPLQLLPMSFGPEALPPPGASGY